ncbi:MAG: bifunctional glycosyltransferase family 2/GtrA family protein [Ruminococcus sp.]|nr:bifunctional glycosyltransferase family 2/GtrA family protein [Ruminococcus sp.]
MEKRIAVILAYEPDESMTETVRKAYESGFLVVAVDDGSGSEYAHIFDSVKEFAHVLSYPQNHGKGYALKTAFKYILENFSGDFIIVTMDCDGQHRVSDAQRVCAESESKGGELVIGSRKQSADSPLRSRFGNSVTRMVFKIVTGCGVYDTQSGLRSFGSSMLERIAQIEGERYEFEMNVLMELGRAGEPIHEIPIETIYIDNNSGSHFNPIKDSAIIYKEILKFSASSFTGFLVDYAMYSLLVALLGTNFVVVANILARVVSSTVNFTINKKLVFRSDEKLVKSAVKYFTLAACILICNTALLYLLTNVLKMGVFIAKILVEICLFIISWIVQRRVVFRKKAREKA